MDKSIACRMDRLESHSAMRRRGHLPPRWFRWLRGYSLDNQGKLSQYARRQDQRRKEQRQAQAGIPW